MSVLAQRVDWILGCCTAGGWEAHGPANEYQVQLSSESAPVPGPGSRLTSGLLTSGDSFDITFTPRPFSGSQTASRSSANAPFTPRQKDLKSQLELPSLQTYPVPPHCSPEEPEQQRKDKLLDMYQEFALDLHTGMYLTQLTSNRDYSDIHCQLMEDMTTLKLDQSNGRIIEFPLTNVSKVYRIVNTGDKWYNAGTPLPPSAMNTEQIVVVEFMRRKLAFVFKELPTAQRFLICMELLIRSAQQKQAMRSLTPTFPAQQSNSRQCPTPRVVHDAMARPTPCPA
eukprot:TRINITY_DN1734_c0_g1_i1.p1 TRINITY_DN1734_c0_g1~~TRINITY_DN1734_c0_g1_i1.p1  ORF type:complete len:283 (+),score=37.43 TRINITY_DN1734_c0_g1_i1:76-924(+)